MVQLARLVEVAPQVWVATSRRYATTSTVVLDGAGGALVIDPAWDADELAAIPADLAALGVRCVAGFSTHRHHDHVLWHPDLGEVPRWASAGTVEAARTDRDAVVAPLQGDLPDELVALAARDMRPVEGEVLAWSGPTVVLHVHDAHAPAHAALELPEHGVLVAGDMLSDVELPMPDEADPDLSRYRNGLESLAEVVGRARILVPGHGSVGDRPDERLGADRRYLEEILERGESDDPRIGGAGMAQLHAANLRRAGVTA